ncbi:MAG: SH3 domain-containing protein [Anaerolineales bacterium]|nr:SH3 domain-containing protein [Anaerolineales bacterium]
MTVENQTPQPTQESSNTGKTILMVVLVVLAALAVIFLAFLAGGMLAGSSAPDTGDEVIEGGGNYLQVPAPAPGDPSVTAVANLNVRAGPGTQYNSYGLLQPGQSAQAVGINSDGTWYAINCPQCTDGIGWASGEYVIPQNIEGLPVIE